MDALDSELMTNPAVKIKVEGFIEVKEIITFCDYTRS